MANYTYLNLLLLLCLLLILCSPSSSSSAPHSLTRGACKASRDRPSCVVLLSSHVPPNATTVLHVIESVLKLTSQNLHKGRTLINRVLRGSTTRRNLTWSHTARTCLDSVRYSEHRVNLIGPTLRSRRKLKDARAWMSAALGYQHGCWSGLKYVQANATRTGTHAMNFFDSALIPGSSLVLAMIFNLDIHGVETRRWGPPMTERDGFWEPINRRRSSGSGGVPAGLKPDRTVCRGGGCDYETVQGAVNAAPNNLRGGQRFVIRIRAGVYDETVRVPLEKKNVVFLGEGKGKTVITGSNSVGLQVGMTTYNSATVGVVGDGFMARDLTVQNTAGRNANQAVAFRSDSDRSVLENCEFLGNQDTLHASSLRQLYKSCRIRGNVDFIFGNSAAVFQDCTVLVAPRLSEPGKGETNTVTAHGRTDPAQSTGFVFSNSVVNGTDAYVDSYLKNPKLHLNYLGRPWKEYSRTVFIDCTLGALISPEGWMPWQADFALQTLYYGEFHNTGPGGSITTKRVNWSSLIPAEHVESYATQNFIQAF